MIDWNEARIEQLKAHVADGLSSAQIGSAMGTTRNAIIGKVKRLGLKLVRKRGEPLSAKRKAPRSVNPFGRKGAAGVVQAAKRRAEKPDAEIASELPPDQSDHAIPFMQATSNHCRWPLNEPTHDMLICGDKPMDGKPYCKRHCKIAYQPIKPRKVKSWIEFRARAA